MHSEPHIPVLDERPYPKPVTDAKTHPAGRFRPGRYNPRRHRDPVIDSGIKQSVKATGVHSPILARAIDGDPDFDFEVVFGHTRLDDAIETHGPLYPMPYLLTHLGEAEAMAIAIVENIHRAPMSAAEEADGAKNLLVVLNNDKDEAARQLGWSRRTLDARLCLTACTKAVLDALASRAIDLGHAELLAGVPPTVQDQVLLSILATRPSVAELKAQLARYARALSTALFDTTQCNGCRHNSAQQAALFAESLGEGFCQAPDHFDELTRGVLEDRRRELTEKYRVVKIVEVKDGFTPLQVSTKTVGEDQYAQCQQCASFGCAISNLPGHQGKVADSLCFDVNCNEEKQSAHKSSERIRQRNAAGTSATSSPAGSAKEESGKHPRNKLAPRVAEYRLARWRAWLTEALTEHVSKTDNTRVLVALMLSGGGRHVAGDRMAAAAAALTGRAIDPACGLAGALAWTSGSGNTELAKLAARIAAAAVQDLAEDQLVALLAYLEIDERRYFTLDDSLLALLNKSELDGLAAELQLDQKIGGAYPALRAKDKASLVNGLLTVDGVDYRGLVPEVMRYPRACAQVTAQAGQPAAMDSPAPADDTPSVTEPGAAAPAEPVPA